MRSTSRVELGVVAEQAGAVDRLRELDTVRVAARLEVRDAQMRGSPSSRSRQHVEVLEQVDALEHHVVAVRRRAPSSSRGRGLATGARDEPEVAAPCRWCGCRRRRRGGRRRTRAPARAAAIIRELRGRASSAGQVSALARGRGLLADEEQRTSCRATGRRRRGTARPSPRRASASFARRSRGRAGRAGSGRFARVLGRVEERLVVRRPVHRRRRARRSRGEPARCVRSLTCSVYSRKPVLSVV